jgi:GH35 family endo-1,4-beta-xylanase
MLAVLLAALSFQVAQEPLIKNGDFRFGTAGWSVPSDHSFVSPNEPAIPGKAIHIRIPKDNGKPTWEYNLVQPIGLSVPKGKRLVLSFWGRSPDAARVSAFVQLGRGSYPDAFRESFKLSPEWKKFEVEGVSLGYATGEANAGLHLNFDSGVIEIAKIELDVVTGQTGSPEKPVDLTPIVDLTRADLTAWKPSSEKGTVSATPEGLKYTIKVGENSNPWDCTLHRPNIAPIAGGDVVVIKLRMRSRLKTKVGINYEKATPNNEKFITQIISLTPNWKEYKVAGKAYTSFIPDAAQLALFMGYESGEVEIQSIDIKNVGPGDPTAFSGPIDYFSGALNPDTWREGALTRIEQNRKSNLRIEAVDPAGKLISNSTIKIRQVNSAFRWGTAAPASLLIGQSESDKAFRTILKRVFNTVVFENDLKWFSLGPKDYAEVDQAMRWLKENNYQVRGHNLVWGGRTNLPSGLLDKSDSEIKRLINTRIAEVAGRFKGQLYCWDVVNEAVTERELWDRLGWEYFAEVFKLAKVADPGAQLVYNDFNITEEAAAGKGHRLRAMQIVRDARKLGAPIEVFGIQGHVGPPLTPIKRVAEILDEVAALGLPLEITEFDLGNVPDARVNAQYIEDFLTVCFANPKVKSFLVWGFWEGAQWRAKEGGQLWNLDFTPTPGGKIFEELVTKRWRTNLDLDARRGYATARAFQGDYDVTIEANGKTVTQRVTLPVGRDLSAKIVVR